MIQYIKGDLLTSDCELIAHGCNCRGGFGSGLAGQIAEVYPNVRDAYVQKHMSEGWRLGDVQLVQIENGRWFANCATQNDYGAPGTIRQYVDYEAIRVVAEKLLKFSIERNLRVAIPKIGAGLAGGDWAQIERIINSVFVHSEIFVYVRESETK